MSNQLFVSVRKVFSLVVLGLIVIPNFQNCSLNFKSASVDSDAIELSSTTPFAQAPLVVLGKDLYSQKCSACHGVYESSNLKGRVITSAKIMNAFTIISAMSPMKGQFSNEQINSLVDLFISTSAPTVTSGPMTSSFSCSSTEAEKNNSSEMIRLTGPELKATYQSLISPSVWAGLADFYYLLPSDNFDGLISNFSNTYSADQVDQVSKFNERLAVAVSSSDAQLSTFFGTCATQAAFTQTCFNSFLNAKGALIFRSPLAADDATRIWTVASQVTSVADKQKVVIQMLFNDPRFLFHVEQGEGVADANGLVALSAYEIANRLSYGMTSAPADATLWTDAVNGNLKQLATVITHVDRLALTTAFKNRVIGFAKFYTGQSNAPLAPNLVEFTAGLNVANLNIDSETEFNNFIDYVVFGSRGTLKDLMSSKAAFPKTNVLASVLGTSKWTSGTPMLAPNHSGLLSRPYLNLNPSANTKYVQRGRRIRLNMLCTDVAQPSAADLAERPTISEQDLLTMARRHYVDKATMATIPGTACYACHSKMNQLGFASSNYDSAGRYVTVEKIFNNDNVKVAENNIDSSSVPNFTEVDGRSFMNLNDFQLALAESDVLHQCLSRKTFQYLTRRNENLNIDSCRLNKIDNQIKSGTPLVDVLTTTFKNSSVLYKRNN